MGINFDKRSHNTSFEKEIDPCLIYEKLDRHASKGPLRKPVQDTILNDWFNLYRSKRDVILKLPTGGGKTIIGLLILLSKLNEGESPCLYLCPNNYLVEQVKIQATEFGIPYCEISNDSLPEEFLNGEKILITNAQSVFNGRSNKFGIDQKAIKVKSILLDDSHSCVNVIKSACRFDILSTSQIYAELLQVFSESLKSQGLGSFADIENGISESQITIPYWDWQGKIDEVVSILSKYNRTKDKAVWYTWELLKNDLKNCICTFSGRGIEISPYSLPLYKFGSFYNANHRVFMSATISDNTFFIKDLALENDVIQSPLTYNKKWSGEKMILIPSLMDDDLTREEIINLIGKIKNPKFGIIVLVPSFSHAEIWKKYGSTILTSQNLNTEIEKYKNGVYAKPLVMASRYDGIDLPDSMCRILILDSLPISETLTDRYYDTCIPNSMYGKVKTAQTIEQGLGRAVRSEKDYCVVLIIGRDIIKQIRSKDSREYFSPQTRRQIEIGLDLARFSKEDKEENQSPIDLLKSVINQCLKRDEGWKNYYVEQMDTIHGGGITEVDEIVKHEKSAEKLFSDGKFQEAKNKIQDLCDYYQDTLTEEEKGWYLQEMARYIFPINQIDAMSLQVEAHKLNKSLFLPPTGYEVTKISLLAQDRIKNIKARISEFETFESLLLFVDDILSRLSFGINADKFERAIDELGQLLGYETERPDHNWKAGPDNLWAIREGEYLFIECKNQVLDTRSYIEKAETGQFSNNCAWFDRYYFGSKTHYTMIIPTKRVNSNTGFMVPVKIMRNPKLKLLKNNLRSLILGLKNIDLKSLSEDFINASLVQHKLTTDQILSTYFEEHIQEKA